MEGLDLGQLVGGQGGNNLSELSKGVVEELGPLTLPVVTINDQMKMATRMTYKHVPFATG